MPHCYTLHTGWDKGENVTAAGGAVWPAVATGDDRQAVLRIAYFAPELGALTSTFIYREVQALRDMGVHVSLFSTRRPTGPVTSGEARQFIDETEFLYSDRRLSDFLAAAARLSIASPGRAASLAAVTVGDAAAGEFPALSGRPKAGWHALVAPLLARRMKERGVQHLHAHFAHMPTTIAMYAAHVAGIPFSFTAHANDIFEFGTLLRRKVARASFAATISEYNRRYLAERGCDPSRIHVIHCGIDTSGYTYRAPGPLRNPPEILSVGRLVEKKGMPVLLDAIARLRDAGSFYRCRIVGDGPQREMLAESIRVRQLSGQVELTGPQPQEQVLAMLRAADLFVLPCIRARSGDQDGIPVALMEAMALGIPVVSTSVSGIPELIAHERNGLLAPPNDAAALADAIDTLLQRDDLRRSFARAARATVEEHFEITRNAARLKDLFEQSAAAAAGAASTPGRHE